MHTDKPIINPAWFRALMLFVFILIINSLGYYAFIFGFGDLEKEIPALAIPYYGPLNGVELLLLLAIFFSITTVVLFCKYFDRMPLRSLGLSRWNGQPLGGIFLAAALLGIGSMILYWTGHLSWTAWQFEPELILLAAFFMFAQSFGEELVFRGYILQNLLKSFNKWIALSLSSIGFASFHAGNPQITILALVNLVAAGMLLGTGYLYTRSIWFPIFFHFAWNFFQGPVLGYQVSGLQTQSLIDVNTNGDELITGGLFGFEGSVISLMLIVITGLLLVWNMQRKEDISKSKSLLHYKTNN